MPPQVASVGYGSQYDPVTPEILDGVREYSSRADLADALHQMLVSGQIRPREWRTRVRAYELLNPHEALFTDVPGMGATPDELDVIAAMTGKSGPPAEHVYVDSRTGTVLRSPMAPDVRTWYRVVPTFGEGSRAFDEGEFPVVLPPSEMEALGSMPPGEAVRILEHHRFRQYESPDEAMRRSMFGDRARALQRALGFRGSAVPPGGVDLTGGAARGPVVDLAHAFRVNAPRSGVVRSDLARPLRDAAPQADLARPLRVAQGGESIYDNYFDMRARGDAGIPSQREGDITVPTFHQPRQSFPMPGVVPLDSGPTTPPDMPHVPPLGRPPVERASTIIPLAQAWAQLLGRTA